MTVSWVAARAGGERGPGWSWAWREGVALQAAKPGGAPALLTVVSQQLAQAGHCVEAYLEDQMGEEEEDAGA